MRCVASRAGIMHRAVLNPTGFPRPTLLTAEIIIQVRILCTDEAIPPRLFPIGTSRAEDDQEPVRDDSVLLWVKLVVTLWTTPSMHIIVAVAELAVFPRYAPKNQPYL